MEYLFGNTQAIWGLGWAGAEVKVHSREDRRVKPHLTRDEEARLVLQIEELQLPQFGFCRQPLTGQPERS